MQAPAAKRRWALRLLAATLSMPLASIAGTHKHEGATASAAGNPYDRWTAQAVATLSHRPDADSLVTAAALQPAFGPSGRQTLQLLDRASRLAPSADDIVALALLKCAEVAGCDAHRLARRLQALAPHNALGWLPALNAAQGHGKAPKVTRILQRMSQASGFETYQTSLARRIQDGLADLPPPPDVDMHHHLDERHDRLLQVRILVSLMPMPAYQPLIKACRPDGADFAQRRSACREIGTELATSWSIIVNIIGVELQRWTAQGAHDCQQTLTRERDMDWLIPVHASCDRAHIAACLDADMQATSELDADRTIARQLGKPPTPPAGWLDRRLQASIRRGQLRFHSLACSDAAAKVLTSTPPEPGRIKKSPD